MYRTRLSESHRLSTVPSLLTYGFLQWNVIPSRFSFLVGMPTYKFLCIAKPQATPLALANLFKSVARVVYQEKGQFRKLENLVCCPSDRHCACVCLHASGSLPAPCVCELL